MQKQSSFDEDPYGQRSRASLDLVSPSAARSFGSKMSDYKIMKDLNPDFQIGQNAEIDGTGLNPASNVKRAKHSKNGAIVSILLYELDKFDTEEAEEQVRCFFFSPSSIFFFFGFPHPQSPLPRSTDPAGYKMLQFQRCEYNQPRPPSHLFLEQCCLEEGIIRHFKISRCLRRFGRVHDPAKNHRRKSESIQIP